MGEYHEGAFFSIFIKLSITCSQAHAMLQRLSSPYVRVPLYGHLLYWNFSFAGEESAFLHNTTIIMSKTAKKKAAPDMYQVITNRIIEQLEKGTIPWRKTWSSYGLARNYVSGKIYKGINMLMMKFFSHHEINYYLTFKQAKELGGKVKKGAKSQQVIYFKVLFKDADGKTISREQAETKEDIKVIKFLKYFNVFNVEDIEGVDFTYKELRLLPNERIERCDQLINDYPSPPEYQEKEKGRAYYHPTDDFINMPPIEQHDSAEFYYSTYFHELVHSTGHQKRLAREEVMNPIKFGSLPYSQEELVAELGASFLCNIAMIDNEALQQNSASYIQGWLSKLRDDKKFVFKASAEAQKAVDYIIGARFYG